jgi:hypothetical protein
MKDSNENKLVDEHDIASELEAMHRDRAVHYARLEAQRIPAGEPGECTMCGEHKPRLVNGVCAKCRDAYKLP